MVKEQQALYVSPHVDIMEIKAQAVICQSGDIDGFNLLDDDTSNWQ